VHLRSRRTRQRCQRRVRKRRRASGGSKRGVLTNGAGGRAFENRLIARRSSTAAVGAGTADVDDRLKGNGSRLVRCGRRSAACRAGQLARSLRQAPRPAGPPPLFAPTTEKWNKTAMETACCRGICTATAFGDVAARQVYINRNETVTPLDAWAQNRRPPAVERAEPVHRQRHAPHHPQSCYVTNDRKSSLSHPDFDVAAKIGSPTSTRLGEGSPAHRNPRVHDRGSRHTTRKTTESIAHSLPNGRPSERQAGTRSQKTRLVETFPTTPRSPFLPGGKNSAAEKPTKNRPFSAENF
jgi:hypothetical protein